MSKIFYKALGREEVWPEISGANPCEITFDDVLLVPQPNTEVASRVLPDISVKLGPYLLQKPIIVAPMDTICGERMIRLMDKLGGIGTLPRGELKTNLEICKRLTKEKIKAVYAIGLRDFLNQAKLFKRAGAKVVLLDVAHGGMKKVVEAAKEVQEKLKLTVITGNIASFSQAEVYKKAGLKIARVGVGPGGLCITRLVAGTGMPQLAAVLDTVESGLQVIADGGIRKPADMTKALAAGASLVMIGSLLAGTEETPGEVIGGKKKARGQASADYMKDNGVKLGEFRAAEGVYTMVEVKGSAEHVINDLAAGLRSAMSYVGANNLKEFRDKSKFVLVSKATIRENQAHLLWE